MRKVNVEVQSPAKFRLRCYEDRGLGGDAWEIAAGSPVPEIPNDEVAAFVLEGAVGTHVEFFNAPDFNQHKTHAVAEITRPDQTLIVPNMRHSAGDYDVVQVEGDSHIDGKVSAIRITRTG